MRVAARAPALLALALLACPQSASNRPSFLIVIADDLRWDALGVVQRERGAEARFPWLETPHLDRLAAEGTRFRNAFVVHSLCSPARASLLTGRYPHSVGVLDNQTPFPSDATTFAGELRGAGYRTGYVGKWHMGTQGGPRPGFDFSASYSGQGRYRDGRFEIDGASLETKGFVDDVATEQAIGFLRREHARDFALVVALKASHGPPAAPPRFSNQYAGQRVGPARNSDHVPPFFREASLTPPSGRAALERRARGHTDDDRQQARTLETLRLVSSVDDNVGKLLAALDQLGLQDRTVVVFTSDNGFHRGEHSMAGKRSAYEESIRIPLLLRLPGLGETARGAVSDALALNIDLTPTLLDLAGLQVPDAVQGDSWRPLLDGTATRWRRSFLYEYFATADFPTPTIVALRTERAKLVRYPGHDAWTELFDLDADPYEIDNVATERPTLRAELERELERQLRAVDFPVATLAEPPGR